MNAVFTAIPLILIRYGLLRVLDRVAFKRAAHFAPLIGKEKAAFWVYQVSSAALLVYPCFLRITADPFWLYAGLTVYGLGILFNIVSVFHYASPNENGFNVSGFYAISRNPMYVAYFIYFLGCVLMTRSWVLFIILLVFQISSHWIILSEERWCIEEFGEDYINYMRKTRRYI